MAKSKNAPKTKPKTLRKPTKTAKSSSQQPQSQVPNPPLEEPAPSSPRAEATDFESWYLQQVTREFADDLDKIRGASDFTERSLFILVAALKQGAGLYVEEVSGRK